MLQFPRVFFQKRYFSAGVIFILSCALMLLGEGRKVRLAETISAAIFSGGERIFSGAVRLTQLKRENQFLRRRNLDLSLKVQHFREAALENIRLRRLLGFKQRSSFSLLPAEVIGSDSNQGFNSITIAVGTKDGVKENMPVITAEGLVGRVAKVFFNCSVVQLLLDRNCRVSAIVQNPARPFGIVEWEGGEKLKLKGIPLNAEVNLGDIVVSSGMGGIFPKGLEIGTITRIGGEELGLFRKVEISPSVRFSHLEEVFVLIKQ